MKHDTLEQAGLSYAPCHYGMSRNCFRGPRRALDGSYIAVMGGTNTYGKFIERPYPSLMEKAVGKPCVNFGLINASVDAFVHDPTIIAACHDAELTVVQIMGAQNLSNRFYKVHPRRNDRFLGASTVLRAIYDDIDFADFNFTRHMLGALYKRSHERFEILREELQAAWIARMSMMLQQVGSKVVLLWMSDAPLSNDPWHERPQPLRADPMFVTRAMVDQLRPRVIEVIEVEPTAAARVQGTKGMVFPLLHADAAAEVLSVATHYETADQMVPVVRRALTALRA